MLREQDLVPAWCRAFHINLKTVERFKRTDFSRVLRSSEANFWRNTSLVDLPALFVHLCRMSNPTCLVAKGASQSVWCVKGCKTEDLMEQMYSVHAFRQHAYHCRFLPCQTPSPPPHPLDKTWIKWRSEWLKIILSCTVLAMVCSDTVEETGV